MKWIASLILLCLLAVPALAQLDYQQGEKDKTPKQAVQAEEKKDDPALRIKKTRAEELAVRPDWYGLFMAWAQKNPSAVLSGLRDQNTFNNFASFIACDWVRDYRNNDVTWPKKQVEIVQKFNERALNPQTRFRLLTYAVLGPYVSEQQQFVFRPLDGAAFSIKFPDNKIFGIEDDCDGKAVVSRPWPTEFVIGFKNPDFVTVLPMEKIKAEYFLANLPKDEKGGLDRRLVVEVEFDVTDFIREDTKNSIGLDKLLPPVKTELTARRAIVYADSNRRKELARFGFENK